MLTYTTISEKATDFCWLELWVSHTSRLASAQPTITSGIVYQSHEKDFMLLKIVLIDTGCTSSEWGGRGQGKMPSQQCPSPLTDSTWRKSGPTCVFPCQVSFGALRFTPFMSLKLLLYMPGELSSSATHSVLCCLGFQGSMKLGCSLRLLSLIIFNVRPKVIFNEAEKYINKTACSN